MSKSIGKVVTMDWPIHIATMKQLSRLDFHCTERDKKFVARDSINYKEMVYRFNDLTHIQMCMPEMFN